MVDLCLWNQAQVKEELVTWWKRYNSELLRMGFPPMKELIKMVMSLMIEYLQEIWYRYKQYEWLLVAGCIWFRQRCLEDNYTILITLKAVWAISGFPSELFDWSPGSKLEDEQAYWCFKF